MNFSTNNTIDNDDRIIKVSPTHSHHTLRNLQNLLLFIEKCSGAYQSYKYDCVLFINILIIMENIINSSFSKDDHLAIRN